MHDFEQTEHLRGREAFSAELALMSGGASGSSTYRVHGLSEPCVLKVTNAESAKDVRTRGHREIHFYRELAADVPLRTPQVLASLIEKSGACVLLIEAHAPIKAVHELSNEVFAEVARQLASLHAMYWGQTSQLDHLSWLKKPEILNIANDMQQAFKTWQRLAQQPQFREILNSETLREIEFALTTLRGKPKYGSEAMLTLCHGDCHLGNLLRDQEGGLVWADWQEVGIGYGSSDLTFLIQRAEASGANVSHEVVLAAYCESLRAAGVQGVEKHVIQFAMRESERCTRLLYWPHHMMDATSETMTRHLAQIFSS